MCVRHPLWSTIPFRCTPIILGAAGKAARQCPRAADAERCELDGPASCPDIPAARPLQRRCAGAASSAAGPWSQVGAALPPPRAAPTSPDRSDYAGMHVAATAVPGAARGSAAAAAPRPPPRRAAAVPSRSGSGAVASPPHLQPVRGAATAAAAAAAPELAEPCPVSAAAFATALDAGASLPHSWLSHWRQQEARREARRALINSTRGRQQQRLRQVATLLAGGGADPGGAGPAAAGLGLRLHPGSSGGWAAADELRDDGAGLDSGSLDLPPLQQMSELDELTWLASHPPEGDEASTSCGGSGMQLWAAAGRRQDVAQHQQHQHEHAAQQHQQEAQRHPGHIVGLAGPAAEGRSPAELQGPLQLRVGSDLLSVRPLWIAVYQPEEGGPAK